jgi:hypothetical protein
MQLLCVPQVQERCLVRILDSRDLGDFASGGGSISRNSYRSLLWHIYELVKRGSNWTSVQYSDSEKTSKAFTEHGLA